MNPLPHYFVIGKALAQARQVGTPVVALESTVITHGLPRPDNLKLAREMEATVRAEGAMPATIGLLDGKNSRPAVGLGFLRAALRLVGFGARGLGAVLGAAGAAGGVLGLILGGAEVVLAAGEESLQGIELVPQDGQLRFAGHAPEGLFAVLVGHGLR